MKLSLFLSFALGLVLSGVQQSEAKCHEFCNHKGVCGANDLCECFNNYGGPSCAARTCPYSFAFGDIVDSSATGRKSHYYLECGGKGVCDPNTGLCTCFEGYTGKGCKRSSCPGGCSGHGVCRTIGAVNSGYSEWDSDKTQVCVCDPGYEGVDCASRMCPVGDDIMTTQTKGDLSVSQTAEVQQIRFYDSVALGSGGVVISYTDFRGETWGTWDLDVATLTAIAIEEALVALPNHAIPSITVSTSVSSGTERTFLVTFTSEENSGDQQMLSLDYSGCTSSGCQPLYSALSAGTGLVTENTKGTTESATCSNRGACNAETGTCVCTEGFHGQACEKQTEYV